MNMFKVSLVNSDDITRNCGTKAFMLSELKKIGVNIPEFYGIDVKDFLQFDNNRQEKTVENNLNNEHCAVSLCEKLPKGKYIIRSSAVPKSIDDLDFASMISGAYESYIAGESNQIPCLIMKVWNSFYSEKAEEQCALFLENGSVLGMGVLIQKYIEPIISGVLHSKKQGYDINWIEGHLSGIVSGEERGNMISCYKNMQNEIILRGVEANILKVVDNDYIDVFTELGKIADHIKEKVGFAIEIEWLYDGKKIWIVQCQKLLEGEI